MQIHRGWENLPLFENVILTIGNYDGVHFGHQQIIKKIVALAKSNNTESVLLTFDPHPRLILRPDLDLKLITTIDEKVILLEKCGLDHIVICPFSIEFAAIPADLYIKDILVKHFLPKKIVIGYDHKFGKDRKGNIELLKEMQGDYNYEVVEISKQTIDDISVNSTKVRKFLLDGNIEAANELLAHPFSLSGIVVSGAKIGRTLGFPTANIKILNDHKLIPPSGVYAIKSNILNVTYSGLLSIGNKPTFGDNLSQYIEAYFFDFDQNIYDSFLEVILIAKVRDEIKFNCKEELITQMKQDVEFAKMKYFRLGFPT